jgi:uncharacterized protein (TIGR02466 family)
MKHPETYDLFPILVQKYSIINDSVILEDIFANEDLGEHQLLIDSKRSKESYVLDNYVDLKAHIQEAIDLYTTKLGIRSIKISQSWYAIANNGGHITRHNHPGSVVSGAYYPFIEAGRTLMAIENPNPDEVWNNLTKYNETAHDFELRSDDLLLFPSRLNHFTDPNQSGTRICVSFNTKYVD